MSSYHEDLSFATGAGAGITGGTGTVLQQWVEQHGDTRHSKIYIDLTGLDSDATLGDIIGVSGTSSACHLGQFVAELGGTAQAIFAQCLETPAGGEVDIDIYGATEATGVTDGAIGDLTETALLAAAADWTAGTTIAGATPPSDGHYLYLTVGTSSTPTAGTYTAGKFLITIIGTV